MHLDELFSIVENASKVRKAIFVVGPPGAGKNTIIDRFFSHTDFKIDDFDDVMQRHKMLQGKEVDYQHSYHLANKRRNIWIQNKLNLIINTTGRRRENVQELKNLLESEGYKTFCIFIKTPYDIAADRIQQRPAQATDVANKGREVDLAYFDNAYIASVSNLKIFKSMFNPVNFVVIVNNPDSEFYKSSLDNAVTAVKRFLRQQ